MKKFLSLFVLVAMIFSLTTAEAKKYGDNYRLEKVLIFSRHNIRSPHADQADPLTPHKWFKWTSPSRELSLRGGVLETEMGQYFRNYLIDEEFMPDNYVPAEGEFLFYANSYQRTIATAQYFSSGMLPIANVEVVRKYKLGTFDPVFDMKLKFVNEKFRAAAEKDVNDYLNIKNVRDMEKRFANDLDLLEKVLDFKDSPYAREHGITTFRSGDTKLVLEVGKEPTFSGTIRAAHTANDALIMQFYEEPTNAKAAFGKKLSDKQWLQIGELNAYFIGIAGIPSISAVEAHPLLECMNAELANDNRRFTFLCGHDTNIIGLLGALRVEDYSLPGVIDTKTPIGVKVVIEKWRGSDGEDYASLNMAYPDTAQIRSLKPMTLENPPRIYPLRLKGLQTNADGLYLLRDVQGRFAEAIAAYNEFTDEQQAA